MATASKKRPKNEPTPLESSTHVNVLNGLLDCYDFLAKNEYSEDTIGIQAFITRKHVGNDNNNNFSEIIDESYKRCQQGNTNEFYILLDEKRKSLPDIDASVEKCLMLTRLATFAQETKPLFTSLISNIRLDMQSRMSVDDKKPVAVEYPRDFRKREQDFSKREIVQEKRRLFYFSHQEVQPLENLIYLQNKTTEHLKYLVNMINTNPKTQDTCINEIYNILKTSFMIVTQPHSGMNPTTIYERKGPGQYAAKINVVIISLLYDFMQLYPNLIEIYPIEPSLSPASDQYKLEEPQSLPWKICQLQPTPEFIPRAFKYADIGNIIIGQASKNDTRVRFAQGLHSFKFAVKIRVNLAHSKVPPVFQWSFESAKFAIGAHNNQLPHLLTRVILHDIRKYFHPQMPEITQIHDYIRRYFIHRTGVRPNQCVCHFLDQELNKAKNNRSQYASVEEIYLDFLANFVSQVEFMAKHPILAMFHADNLFLSICNGDRVAEAIIQTCGTSSPVIGLRFNSIRIDYGAIASASVASRTIKTSACAVRVDIYNDRSKKFQNRTFDSTSLLFDISKFIISAQTSDSNRIRILSNFDSKANDHVYESLDKFKKYFHGRLKGLVKTDEKYKPVTDLVDNANETSPEDIIPDLPGSIAGSAAPDSVSSAAPTTPEFLHSTSFDNFDASQNYEYPTGNYMNNNHSAHAQPMQTRPTPPGFSSHPIRPSLQSNQYISTEGLLQLFLSQPHNIELLRQSGIYNIAEPILPRQAHAPPPPPYQPPTNPYLQTNSVYPSVMSPASPMYHPQQSGHYYPQQQPQPMTMQQQMVYPPHYPQPPASAPPPPPSQPMTTTVPISTNPSMINHGFVQDTVNPMQDFGYPSFDSFAFSNDPADVLTMTTADHQDFFNSENQLIDDFIDTVQQGTFDLSRGTEKLNLHEPSTSPST